MSTKVFVGNLPFRTTDQALQEAFAAIGEVKSGVHITRGRRSLGYGFVEFANTEQAQDAVTKFNNTELFGRPVKVEIAKDPSERPEQDERDRDQETGPAKRRARRGPNRSRQDDRRDDDEYSYSKGDSAPYVSKAGNRASADSGNVDNRNVNKDRPAPRRRRLPQPRNTNNGNSNGNNKPVARKHNNTNNGDNDNANAGSSPKQIRQKRVPKPQREKIPSKTTLFVANLPFSLDDEGLAKIFSQYKVKAAHVVRIRRNNRSRGFGFVEFETEGDQVEALKTCNGTEVEKRPIAVSISHSVAAKQSNENENVNETQSQSQAQTQTETETPLNTITTNEQTNEKSN